MTGGMGRDFDRDRDRDRDRGFQQSYPGYQSEPAYQPGSHLFGYQRNYPDRMTGVGRDRDLDYNRDIDFRREGYGSYGSSSSGYGMDYGERRGFGESRSGAFLGGREEHREWRDRDRDRDRENVGIYGRSYIGLGPRAYRRADARISEDVCDRLTDHPEVDASDIEVEVKEGEVTLKGHVPERRMKRLAEDIVENITGVREVHNQIRVKGGLMDKIFGSGEEKSSTER